MLNLLSENSSLSHIGIIMDGNRRWAKEHHLPAIAGHSRGAEVLKKISKYCNKINLKYLTVYAFSTENWSRSTVEVNALMMLFRKYIKDFMTEFENENMKIRFIGDLSAFSEDIVEGIEMVQNQTKNRTGLNLNIAMNYGGKNEIVNAAKSLCKKVKLNEVKIEDINEEIFENELYTKSQPNVDLMIRTADEKRLSNFMLWQCAYSEFFFTDVFWPDFSSDLLDDIINDFFKRTRRFGGQ